MKQFETKNYIFNFEENSFAHKNIEVIAAEQEVCFSYICSVLRIKPDFKIKYFLCETPEDVGRIYGDNDPCNGFASPPDTIYAVYNEKVKCVGFHEDAHIISYIINRPDCPAVREGLAMFFDRKWWGIGNLDWCGYYIENSSYIPIDTLMDEDSFFTVNDARSYPIMGAFTDYLITSYGIDLYLKFYKKNDSVKALEEIYGKSSRELNMAFEEYIRLFPIDKELKKRMEELSK